MKINTQFAAPSETTERLFTETLVQDNPSSAQPPGGPPQKSGSKYSIKTFAIVAVLLTVVFLVWRWRTGGPIGGSTSPKTTVQAANRTQIVQVATTRTGNLQQTLAVTGTLKADLSVNLSSKISGRVERVLVLEGSPVRRGQLLVTLEDEELISQVSSAAAAVESAQAQVRQREAQLRQRQVQLPATSADIEASIQDAQANLAAAQAKYRQTVLKQPAQEQTTRADVENARQSVRTAQTKLSQTRTTARQTQAEVEAAIQGSQASVKSAQAALAEVRRGSRQQEIAQSQQNVEVLEAQLANAETTVKRSEELVRVGVSAQSELDTARTQRDVYKSQLEAARQALSLVREGSTNEQIRQAEESVRLAQASLNESLARRANITNAQRDVTSAQASLATAQSNLRTAQANLSNIPVTQQDTRIALQTVRQAQATLAKAQANRADIPVAREEISSAREDIESARTSVRQAQETLQQARLSLSNARIFSPIDGVVNSRSTAPGATVTIGSTLMNLVSTDTVYFEAQADENNVRQIQVGQKVQVTAASVSDKPLAGTVADIIAIADAARQFRVRVALPKRAGRLTSGASARGEIVMQSAAYALLVPEDAVRQNAGQKTVLVVDGNGDTSKTVQRVVGTGMSSHGMTQILSGLQNGERVVVGNPLLKSGTPVRISSS